MLGSEIWCRTNMFSQKKKVCTQVKSENDKKNLNMYAGFISINFNLKHKMGIIEW